MMEPKPPTAMPTGDQGGGPGSQEIDWHQYMTQPPRVQQLVERLLRRVPPELQAEALQEIRPLMAHLERRLQTGGQPAQPSAEAGDLEVPQQRPRQEPPEASPKAAGRALPPALGLGEAYARMGTTRTAADFPGSAGTPSRPSSSGSPQRTG